MRRILPVLALAFPALSVAEELPGSSKDRERAFKLLPEGSQLKGVMIPRYDNNRRLVGVLKSKVIRLVNSEELAGEAVSIEFFNKDQTPGGRIDLAHAIFNEGKGMLVAKEVVHLRSESLTARGTALHYSFLQGEGFLSGPVTTIVQAPIETTMNPKPSLRATTVLGMSLLAQSLSAAPPPTITAAEKAAIRADAASRAPAAAKEAAITRAGLEKDVADSAALSQTATRFLVQADLPVPPKEEEFAPAVPFDLKPGPNDSTINSEGGMYFNPEEGVLVYMKNVKVDNPDFSLKCDGELKIYFAKKPVEEKKKEEKPAGEEAKNEKSSKQKDMFGGDIGGDIGVDFEKPERIIATGAVLFEQKQTKADQQPIKASGAIFSYNIKDDHLIISGGYPWVVQPPSSYFRAKEPNLSLRISPKAGRFVTEGNWESGANIETKDKKEK